VDVVVIPGKKDRQGVPQSKQAAAAVVKNKRLRRQAALIARRMRYGIAGLMDWKECT
jgi:hypothetical protein